MKIYVLVDKQNNSLQMPTTFGRHLRAYTSERRAKVYGRKFNCSVVELEVDEGKIVWKESVEKNTPNQPTL